MKNRNIEFYIYKYSYKTDDTFDLSFLPLGIRGKLSILDKLSLSTMVKCYEKDSPNLIFASRYGKFTKLVELIKQYTEDKETSPMAFSASVHNFAIGLFSLLNKIHTPYNSISAGKNTLSHGLLDAILNSCNNTLFCYSDALDKNQSISCLIGKEYRENAIKINFKNGKNNDNIKDEFESFLDFLQGKDKEFKASYYTLTRCDK